MTYLKNTYNPKIDIEIITSDGSTITNGKDLVEVNYQNVISIIGSFSSPNNRPAGLAYDGTNLMSCDYDTYKMYKHNGLTSTILDSFSSPSTQPTGLTWDGTNLISCDYVADKIYKHNGFSSTILDSFSSPNTYPYGLAWDGTNLMSCSFFPAKMYKHSGFSSTILDSFSISTSVYYYPTGLTWDGTNLWITSYDSDKIYKHSGFSSTVLLSFSAPDGLSTGLTWDGTHLISCDGNVDKIFIHDVVIDRTLNLHQTTKDEFVTIKEVFGSNDDIIITPFSGQTINGQSTYTITTSAYKSVSLISDGSEWFTR